MSFLNRARACSCACFKTQPPAEATVSVAQAKAEVTTAAETVRVAKAEFAAAETKFVAAEKEARAIEDKLAQDGLDDLTRKIFERRLTSALKSLDHAHKSQGLAHESVNSAQKFLSHQRDLCVSAQKRADPSGTHS